MVSPSWTLDSNVTSHQTIDRLTVGHREREIDRKRRRDLDKRWVKRRSGPVPRGQSDSDMLSSPETQWFLILLATVVMNTGSDSQRHRIKVIVHPLVVLVLYTVRLPSLTLSSTKALPGCFLAAHSVVIQSPLSFESDVFFCLFVRKITKTTFYKWACFKITLNKIFIRKENHDV